MSDDITIKQEQKLGNNGTQIGVQSNVDNHPTIYVGATLEEISRLVTNLFLDNFPRMQQIARVEAENRMNELWDKIVICLSEREVTNLSPFMETDVQYAVYEAQKNYARFATPDLLDKLSSLIAERVKYNDEDMCLKIAIDQAISIIGMLSHSQLDYLALLFLTTKVKYNIFSLEQLKSRFEYLDNVFSKSNQSSWQHLNMLGCFQLDLPDICKINANFYNFNKLDVERICPENIKALNGDYSTSPIGTIIAIIHAEQKTKLKFNPKLWIHD